MAGRKGFIKLLSSLEQAVMLVTLVIIIVLICIQVVFRYVLGSAILWSDEVVGFLFVLLTMIGSAAAVREGLHSRLAILEESLPPLASCVLKILNKVLVIGFLVFFLIYSSMYSYENRALSSTMLGIPMFIPYAVLPFGTLLMLIEVCFQIVRDWSRNGKQGGEQNWS